MESRLVDKESRIELDAILPLVYDEMRSCASRALANERQDHTLQTTELVHEAYVRLAKLNEIDWNNSKHILRAAIGVMRRVLIDHARARNCQKRGNGKIFLSCAEDLNSLHGEYFPPIDLLALDVALQKLRRLDEQKAEIVELRYFGGQTIHDVAQILDISNATVKRNWSFAKAWLHRELSEDTQGG